MPFGKKSPFQPAPSIKEISRYKNSGSVLDIGTGAGRNALYLAQKGFDVTAVDNSEEKLSLLKTTAKGLQIKLHIKLADIKHLRLSK